MKLKATPDSGWEDVQPWVVWWFEENDTIHVMDLCHAGLERMDAILKELKQLRIGMALPADEELPGPVDSIPAIDTEPVDES